MSNITKPNDGRVKEGGWGASSNPSGWRVDTMRDDQTLFKVVDDNTGKNVADRFTERANAQQFIDYHKFKQEECKNSGTQDEPTTWNYINEKCTRGFRSTGSTTRDGVIVPYKIKGEWKYNVSKDPRDGGARYNMPAAGTSVVMVGYFTMNGGSDDVSAKLLGGEHSDDEYRGTCYDLGIKTNTGKPRLRCECPHPEMSDDLDGIVNQRGLDFMNKWVGMMAVAIQEPDGVRLRYYQDQGNNDESPANQWKLLYEYFDTGQHKPGDDDFDESKFPLRNLNTAEGTAQNTWRIDHSPGLKEKWLAIAEIDIS
jgi:hypothetical protein